MCLALYIASDHPLPLEAQVGSLLAVREAIHGPHNPVLQQVSKQLLYAVRPHLGCALAFEFLPPYEREEGEFISPDSPEGTALRSELADYLSAALRHQATVEVYACCSGDEDFPPSHRRRARPADFIHDRTLFRYGELVVVSDEYAAPDAAPDPAREIGIGSW